MIEGKNYPVQVPEDNLVGKTLILNNGYVYWYTKRQWNSEKMRTVDDRLSIGKLVFTMEGFNSEKDAVIAAKDMASSENPLMMWPNKNYIKLFGGNPENHMLLHNSIMGFGVYLFALKASEQTGVLQGIKAAFPKQWPKAFAICVEWLGSGSDVSQKFETWFYDHFCGFYTALDPSAFTDFYAEIGAKELYRETYRKTFHEEYLKKFPASKDGPKRAVGCDGTNENHESKANEFTGYGHAKDDKDRMITSRMTFVDEETGITLFSDNFPGPLLDKTEIPHTLEKLIDIGFEYLHIMFDRGFITEIVAKHFQVLKKEYGVEFSAMVPSTYSFAEEYIRKNKEKVTSEHNYIPEEDIYGIHMVDMPVFESPGKQENEASNLFDVYVFYDEVRATEERSAVNNKVTACEDAIRSRKEYTDSIQALGKGYFTITQCEYDPKTGRNFTWQRNHDVIAAEKELKGYFVMISNSGVSASEEIVIARKRDKNEKTYKRRKSFLGCETPATGTNETFLGKSLIADIAQNVSESMEYYAKPFLNKKRSETFETFLAKLGRYKIEVKSDGTIVPRHGMRKDEKEMFACLNLSAPIIEEYIRTLRWGSVPGMIMNDTEYKEMLKMKAEEEKEAKKAQREEERKAVKAQKEAQRQAEKAKKKAQRQAEKAQKEAQRQAEKAKKEAQRQTQKAPK